MSRWIVALLIGSALALSGCNAGGLVDKITPIVTKTVDLEGELTRVFGGPADQKLGVGSGVVVVSPESNGQRQVGYVVQEGEKFRLAGPKVALPSEGAVTLSAENGWVVIKSLRAGAPQFTAFQPGGDGLQRVEYYSAKAPDPANKQGHHVTINKDWNVLWHYQNGKLVKTYRVATGRDKGPLPTWEDFKTNYTTPEGSFKLTNFIENPGYTTLKPGEKSYEGGHPENPLGTRWMGFPVLGGNDSGGIYAVHGTSEPDKIGTWASDGCIRMQTKEAEELFAILKGKNATLQIVAR